MTITASFAPQARHPFGCAALLLALGGCGGGAGPAASAPVTVIAVSSASRAPDATPTPAPTSTSGNPSASAAAYVVKAAFYIGSDPADVANTERWFGRKADGIQLHGGRANWDDWLNSIGWAASIFAPSGADLMWSIPLIPNGATLEQAADGGYDVHYTAQARNLLSKLPGDRQIYIRLGWEFNGDWQPWRAKGHEIAYKTSFCRIVRLFRAESSRFVFEWTPNVGDVGMDPETAYPGDACVDVIGLDFYYSTKYLTADPEKAWSTMVSQRWGLQWHQEFAASHGKPTAYAEWGVDSDSAGPFIAHARDWFVQHRVLYQSYWNSNADFAGQLSADQYPAAAKAFTTAFAADPYTGPVRVPRE